MLGVISVMFGLEEKHCSTNKYSHAQVRWAKKKEKKKKTCSTSPDLTHKLCLIVRGIRRQLPSEVSIQTIATKSLLFFNKLSSWQFMINADCFIRT